MTGNLIQLNLNTQKIISNFLYGERNAILEKTEKRVMQDSTIKTQKLRFKGARINIYREPMKRQQAYPAWNIDHSYLEHPQKISLIKHPEIIRKSNKVSIISEYNCRNSTFTIIYTIRAQSKALDVNIKVNLKDKKTLLKYFIPLNLHSEYVRCEIPYGSILRSRNPKSEMEEGKWEFSMQKWIDISDNDIGLAVLNTSKYGVSANMKGISITLLRSPHYPKDPYHTREIKIERKERPMYTDIGEHDIALRLVPHQGSWLENQIPHMALAFNNPVVYISSDILSKSDEISKLKLKTKIYNEKGVQGKEIEFPKIISDNSNVIVTAFKPSEWISNHTESEEMDKFYEYEDYILPENLEEWKWDKKSLIIRAYECGGIKLNTPIRLYNISENLNLVAEEVNLLEYKIGQKLEVVRNIANNTVVINTEFTPFEIKTIRLTLK
jgi:alpha-mannosidase